PDIEAPSETAQVPLVFRKDRCSHFRNPGRLFKGDAFWSGKARNGVAPRRLRMAAHAISIAGITERWVRDKIGHVAKLQSPSLVGGRREEIVIKVRRKIRTKKQSSADSKTFSHRVHVRDWRRIYFHGARDIGEHLAHRLFLVRIR